MRNSIFRESGSFETGCNYVASHAGTRMWSDWRPREVARDLDTLSRHGITLVRVLLIWPDFQPITALRTYHGIPREVRIGDELLPDTDAGRAGMDPVMLDRFADFADMAEKRGISIVVALLTGWMSGRLFVPPALEGLNVLTDPTALMWQTRFVTAFVSRFRKHKAVAAWDLGNECNCMAPASREAAWAWTALISKTIRSLDDTHPVISGMHSLPAEPDQPWSIRDQAELSDVLTTHPYPVFTPHCARDPVNTLRSSMHATAETRLYTDIGGKPAIAEEIGALGRMICSEEVEAVMARTNLFSLWANDCRAFMWWCGFDLRHLAHAPYDWDACERDLGLFTADRKPKPIVRELQAFRDFREKLPFRQLPAHTREAVCILTRNQDQWGVAYSAFTLAKQAGFDVEFQYSEQPLKKASLYLLPSVKTSQAISRRSWLALLERVRRGATLFVSLDDCMLSPFCREAGFIVESRQDRVSSPEAVFDETVNCPPLPVTGGIRYNLRANRATVLGHEPDGNPVFTSASFGKGRILVLTFPLETRLAQTAGAFAADAPPYWRLYNYAAASALKSRVCTRDLPHVAVTEHHLGVRSRVIVLVNHAAKDADVKLTLRKPWRVRQALRGKCVANSCSIGANDAAVVMIENRN